eukprot:COSAG02_NODE_4128_length_5741_cov_2.944700_1_plen_561_part_00
MIVLELQDHLVRDIQAICDRSNAAARRRHDVQLGHHQLRNNQHPQDSGISGENVVNVAIKKRCIVKVVSAEDTKRRTRRKDRSSRFITVKYAIANTSSAVDADDTTAETRDFKLHELHADMVLVTLPLGVLQQSVPKPARGASTAATAASASTTQEECGVDQKQAAITFLPTLSTAKQEAIHALGMGLENKVLLRFPIHGNDLNHTSTSSGGGASSQAAAVHSAEYTQPDLSPFIRRLKKLKYFQVADPKFRLLSLHGMDHRAKPGCLLVHVAPPHAYTTHKKDPKAWTADGTEYEVVAEIMELLRDIFGPTVHVPQPIEVKVTEWHRDPFALGAYSHMPPNATVMHKHQMLQPEGVAAETAATDCGAWGGRLLFAGEGCSIHAHQCVHGAFETGVAQAIKMLKTLACMPTRPVAQTTVHTTTAEATAAVGAGKASAAKKIKKITGADDVATRPPTVSSKRKPERAAERSCGRGAGGGQKVKNPRPAAEPTSRTDQSAALSSTRRQYSKESATDEQPHANIFSFSTTDPMSVSASAAACATSTPWISPVAKSPDAPAPKS